MRQGDRRRYKQWLDALTAAHGLPRWLCWRWLFAQDYNAHQPQSNIQREHKLRAGRVAGLVVEAMGGSLMAPPPPGLDSDEAWRTWLKAAQRLEPEQRRSLLLVLLDRHLGTEQMRDDAAARARQLGRQLALLLVDLAAQERARAAGWRPGRPSKPHKGATRRRKA